MSNNSRFPLVLAIAFLPFLILSVSSCRSKSKKTAVSAFQQAKFDEDDFADALEDIYATRSFDDTAWAKTKLHNVDDVAYYVYRGYEHIPLWLNENGDTKAIESFIAELEDIKNDGLDPEAYKLSELKKQLADFKQDKTPEVPKLLAFDTTLTRSYLTASRNLHLGKILPKQADSLWYHANDSTWAPELLLTDLLYADGKYPSLDSFRSRIGTYGKLRALRKHYTALEANEAITQLKPQAGDGMNDSILRVLVLAELPQDGLVQGDSLSPRQQLIKSYQAFYSLKQTGKIDSATESYLKRTPADAAAVLDANMERLRWMPQQMEPLHILVNIPLMELFLRKDGADAMHMRVVVGKNARQTPVLNAMMTNVVINPPWGVPPTILKKDVLPGITKSGSAYLAKKGLRVYDLKGNHVDASQVNASNYKRFVFKQPPGDDNALGYVKFNLPNKWDIYLHDTPHREDFPKSDRALSSGCIRVQQPREMAEYILTELNNKRYPLERIDSVIVTHKTRYEVLKNKIPVHIVYLTAFDDSTYQHVRILKDFYKRDAKLIAALKQR
jgi:murein L,D-transpeptidase YcbB/YkuD